MHHGNGTPAGVYKSSTVPHRQFWKLNITVVAERVVTDPVLAFGIVHASIFFEAA